MIQTDVCCAHQYRICCPLIKVQSRPVFVWYGVQYYLYPRCSVTIYWLRGVAAGGGGGRQGDGIMKCVFRSVCKMILKYTCKNLDKMMTFSKIITQYIVQLNGLTTTQQHSQSKQFLSSLFRLWLHSARRLPRPRTRHNTSSVYLPTRLFVSSLRHGITMTVA